VAFLAFEIFYKECSINCSQLSRAYELLRTLASWGIHGVEPKCPGSAPECCLICTSGRGYCCLFYSMFAAAFFVSLDKPIEDLFEPGVVLTDSPRNTASRAQNKIFVHTQVREYLPPEFGKVAIDYRYWNQARVNHLEKVFVLQIFINRCNNSPGPRLAR